MIKGVVEDIFLSGAKQGKKGTYFQTAVTVGGVRYSGFLQKAVKLANKGDTVEFAAEQTDDGKYWNFDAKTFTVIERGTVQVADTGATSNSGGSSGGNSREAVIVRQNALAHATNIVTALLAKSDVEIKDVETSAVTAAKLAVSLAAAHFTPYSLEGVVNGATAVSATTDQDGNTY